MTVYKDVIIIGAGPAGLAAAVEVKKNGVEDVLVIEREPYAGGILNQCIHDGFGVTKFKEALTGPEYAGRYIDEAKKLKVEILSGAMVIDLTPDRGVTVISPEGMTVYKAGAVILAMGCRERTRGALSIPGTRPAGIYTAGVAQHFVNLKNIMIGRKVIILGSGDIGLIMARRLTLEGAEVIAVLEKLPYTSGLPRNITQCLEDYGIPLLLKHTVVNIEGRERLKSVTIAEVDDKGKVIRGNSQKIECDTLILSVGLIPENELSIDCGIKLDPVTSGAVVDEELQTSIPGIFACGNVLQVHDLVDHVSEEGEHAGRSAVAFVKNFSEGYESTLPVKPGSGIRYVVPQLISGKKDITVSMRVSFPSRDKKIFVKDGEKIIKSVSYKKLSPAEMARIKLNEKELRGIKGLEVVVGD
jgi:thioredoxin reductase